MAPFPLNVLGYLSYMLMIRILFACFSVMEKAHADEFPLTTDSSEKQGVVCIFGTGDFGKSLGLKMLQCGYSIVFGSRNPQVSSLLPRGAEVLSYSEAASKSDIIILAMHREHYDSLTELVDYLKGKVLVDVSNNRKINQYPESNAEYLAQLEPGAHVVKAFNTISAWALQSGTLDASRQVRLNELEFSRLKVNVLICPYLNATLLKSLLNISFISLC
jgi:hypothetical protein